ncbi:hypothetical protein SAMN05216352_10514 [Alteribacillus bidgolensis]|uniref:Uncharacterized protein n=2 Tax=Alteribacillus bidgolensis TaxID=930129 RepID=A0A1G8I2L6_9BACI|nr:hypothetical protein SAMN05216352_10514 [Alteribacillus bidgolensis]
MVADPTWIGKDPLEGEKASFTSTAIQVEAEEYRALLFLYSLISLASTAFEEQKCHFASYTILGHLARLLESRQYASPTPLSAQLGLSQNLLFRS